MPVIGHAFVGMGTAMCMKPAPRASLAAPLWAPTVVTLAYLPDVVSHLSALVGFPDMRMVAHSATFAIVVSMLVAIGLARLGSISRFRAFAISALSILMHDGLDLLQATDRQAWWPFSSRQVGIDLMVIPGNPYEELLLFGAAFCVFSAAWITFRRRRRQARGTHARKRLQSVSATWIARTLTIAILLSASITHYLRGARQRQTDQVHALLQNDEFVSAIALIKEAERWPSGTKPGRFDYAVAEAYARRGDRQRSEDHYLRAYEADPSYFWVVADLAVFYASGDEPSDSRRVRTEPYLRKLKSGFAGHGHLSRVLAKVERKLAQPMRGAWPRSDRAAEAARTPPWREEGDWVEEKRHDECRQEGATAEEVQNER
jgi:membrane-bound metal-dependent hydrolase YbcI (DUF457 family)